MKRVLVDMSVTLLHNGHIRLLKRAKEMEAHVIVALTTDEEVLKYKGYEPELSFEQRKEMLLSLRYVDEVVESPWLITEDFIKSVNADCLVHAGENFNPVENVCFFDRTEGVSSSDMRANAIKAVVEKLNSEQILMTPGPGNLHPENLTDMKPAFSRGDPRFSAVLDLVLERILALAGQENIVTLQGSATTAIEIATSNFLSGSVVAVESGFYSRRLASMVERKKDQLGLNSFIRVDYDQFLANWESLAKVDWMMISYTETADGFLADLKELRRIADRLQAKIILDSAASINLEDLHDLADICTFSSCKGLGGLTGAAFITFNNEVLELRNEVKHNFILDIDTYMERRTTPPVHALLSMHTLSGRFNELGNRVRESKIEFMRQFGRYSVRPTNQPVISTKVRDANLVYPQNVVVYQPREIEAGCQVICHLFDQFPSNRQVGDLYWYREGQSKGAVPNCLNLLLPD